MIEAQLDDGRILEFPDGTDQQVIQVTVKKLLAGAPKSAPLPEPEFEREARETLSVTPAELISANPIIRAATSAARPIIGASNLIARQLGLEGVPLEQLDEMQRRGAKALGFSGVETIAQDIAGALVGPLGAGALKTVPLAATAPGRIAQGTMIGGLAGVTAGGEEPLLDAGTGALVGAAIPAAIEGGRTVATQIRNVSDLFRGERGAANILDRYLQRIIGEGNVPTVARALRSGGQEPIPGFRPTAAEAVAGLPEGSPIVAHQRITAAGPGGPSAQFGRRVLEQKDAIEAAKLARDAKIVPGLKQSLQQANQAGIQSNDIVAGIDAQLQQPGLRASDVVQKTLGAVKEKISAISQNGIVDGEDLWTVRKEIGNTIRTAAKETANWDKRLSAGLEIKIQKTIDDAIVKAGGTDWPVLMAEFAARSQAIEAVKATAKSALRPAQRTDLLGGLRIAEETRAHVPQLLSRPMMAANAILRYFSANIEPNIDKIATQRSLNPIELADALDKLPLQVHGQVLNTMAKIGIAPAVQQAIEQQRTAEGPQ